jgi:hydroxymethylpyrimidine pyrophosphatase-like HAD family hydrolase
MKKSLVIYVDVDETFVRKYRAKRIAMPNTIKHIQELKKQGIAVRCLQ